MAQNEQPKGRANDMVNLSKKKIQKKKIREENSRPTNNMTPVGSQLSGAGIK